jgi:nucleotide-binding universal stress UspA family protein
VNTILLATDGSPSARQATTFAIGLAVATGWRLQVITVWTVPTMMFGELPAESWQGIAEAAEKAAQEYVDDAVADARACDVEAEGTIAQGDVVSRICHAAKNATVVVAGAHGWGTVKRLVFGSVSSSLLHEAPCPVLVVREDVAVLQPAPAVERSGEA